MHSPPNLLLLSLLFLFHFPSEIHRTKQQEPNTSANCTSVVRPRCAQETWVAIVAWWNDRNSHRVVEMGEAFAFVVDDEFEDTVLVWGTEAR